MYQYKYYNYYKISNQLLEFHELFYKFWTVGRPTFTNKIPTAAVCFNKKDGKFFQFLFNPDFWDSLDDYERCFVIAHECLHVVLNHGIRARDGEPRKTAIAIDIIVNYILSNNLGLKLTPKLLEGSHFQTVFKDHKKIPKNKSFEYYYNLLEEHPEEVNDGVLEGAGDHGYLMELDMDGLMEYIFENQNLTDEQKKEIKNKIEAQLKQAGTESLDNIMEIYGNSKRKLSFKWEQLMKHLVRTKMSIYQREYAGANWTKEDRRTALLPSDVIMPLYLNEKPEFKNEMWFFTDCSGSCSHLVDQFTEVARSIPEKIFDVKYHIFDTITKEWDIKKTYAEAGGGTCFSQIETYIQNKIKKEKIRYPKTVFIITDGCGTPVKPEYPANWFWILSADQRDCIPTECNIIPMSEI